MPFFKSMRDDAGPPDVFATYPQLYGLWAEMSQVLMRGLSPLTPDERELILAFAAGTAACDFVYTAHSGVAYAWGFEARQTAGQSGHRADRAAAQAAVGIRAQAGLAPGRAQSGGCRCGIRCGLGGKSSARRSGVTARMSFMQRLVEGHGFATWSRDAAREHAQKRVKLGYVNLYPAFAKQS